MHGSNGVTQGSEPRCAAPIEFEALIAYWLGELRETAEASIEEHLFACAHCTRRLGELAAVGAGVRAAVQGGVVSLVVSGRFVEAMKQSGLHVREYRLGPGASVNCTIRADDDAVVSRVTAPLAGVKRLDAVEGMRIGDVEGPEARLEDIPFDPDAGEVLFIHSAVWLRALPASTLRKRLIAVGEAGERLIGEYTFLHSPQ
jgi:hypothetical protein